MEIQLTAIYSRDSKRYHRYVIDEGQEIKGSIYVLKSQEIPSEVIIQLKTIADSQKTER